MLYAFCLYAELQVGSGVFYSKYFIPIAVKSLDYFRSEDSEYSLEENVFWLLVCITNNYAKRYYNNSFLALHNQDTSKEAPLLQQGIRIDMCVFEYFLKKKNENLSNFLHKLSFGVSLYFAERLLSLFADLFNHELLYRIWDFLFLEGSSSN